jgi:hypothetical protein
MVNALNIVLALLFYKRFRISLYRLETSSSTTNAE